ncbi:hypothetical protein AF72_03540 [Xylella taiwanensis]|uniref:Uncharacterized protein n=1 Tax=Xylella taiwanensis TaxID=1444770 RepID=Z9JKF8_9GAMM|nr:hypothetical protein AF72_03540 [Xylella taiwanensis]
MWYLEWLGTHMMSGDFAHQITELQEQAALLDRFTQL